MYQLLKELRVLDFSQNIPGPYATLMLAQLGADVLKVERPGGEAMRTYGPLDSDGVSAFYKTLNAGKTVSELDLKSDRGRRSFAQWLAKADVLVESFRPGVMARLGFDPDILRERYPQLIVCSISGFGQTGPYRLRAGHDINFAAYSGLLEGTGTENVPVLPSPPVSDYASGIQAAMTVLAAVHARSQSGKGAYLDVSIADTVLAWHAMALSNLYRDGFPLDRGMGMESGATANCGIYETADERFVTLGAESPQFWTRFCEAVERLDWIERFDDPIPQSALRCEVSALFRSQPLSDWILRLDNVDCCFEPVLKHAELHEHPQIAERRMLREEHWPEPLVQTAYPAWVDGVPPASLEEPKRVDATIVLETWGSP